jgi:hypothetical protein
VTGVARDHEVVAGERFAVHRPLVELLASDSVGPLDPVRLAGRDGERRVALAGDVFGRFAPPLVLFEGQSVGLGRFARRDLREFDGDVLVGAVDGDLLGHLLVAVRPRRHGVGPVFEGIEAGDTAVLRGLSPGEDVGERRVLPEPLVDATVRTRSLDGDVREQGVTVLVPDVDPQLVDLARVEELYRPAHLDRVGSAEVLGQRRVGGERQRLGRALFSYYLRRLHDVTVLVPDVEVVVVAVAVHPEDLVLLALYQSERRVRPGVDFRRADARPPADDAEDGEVPRGVPLHRGLDVDVFEHLPVLGGRGAAESGERARRRRGLE